MEVESIEVETGESAVKQGFERQRTGHVIMAGLHDGGGASPASALLPLGESTIAATRFIFLIFDCRSKAFSSQDSMIVCLEGRTYV